MEPTDQSAQERMFTLIEAWKESGLSQAAFCKERGVAYHRFHYWFKKYNDQNASAVQPTFSELTLPTSGGGCLEVIYPDGRKVIFHQPVDVSFLRHLLS